jgi:hypothetical protein
MDPSHRQQGSIQLLEGLPTCAEHTWDTAKPRRHLANGGTAVGVSAMKTTSSRVMCSRSPLAPRLRQHHSEDSQGYACHYRRLGPQSPCLCRTCASFLVGSESFWPEILDKVGREARTAGCCSLGTDQPIICSSRMIELHKPAV